MARLREAAVAALAVVAAGVVPAAAQERAGAPPQPQGREHVVRRGDTLWDLAGFYLNNPFLWGLIYDANRETVEDPHWIYPSERLRIPPLPPAVPSQTAGPPAAPAETPNAPVSAAPEGAAAEPGAGAEPQPGAQPAVPAAGAAETGRDMPVEAGDYYAAPWLGDETELPAVAELIGTVDRGTADTKLPEMVFRYDRVYLRYTNDARPQVGDRLLLVQTGRFVDGLGSVIVPGGVVTIEAAGESVLTGVVSEQFERIATGALAIPLDTFPGMAGPAQPVEDGIEGKLVAFVEEQPVPGVADQAFIDIGAEQGLAIGDELIAYVPERRAPLGYTETLPPEPVARLRVIRVAANSATVQVESMTHAMLRPGLPVRLVGKVP